MSYHDLLKDVWNKVNHINWKDDSFSLEKAYVSSIFSTLAYLHIPEYELKENKRIKIVPCDEYQIIINSGSAIDIRNVLQEMDLGEVFIIQRRFSIILGVKVKNVIFVAIRGTKQLYDWLINFRATKYEYRKDPHIIFHKGFYKAIHSCYTPLSEELKKFTDGEIPIYVTGHSLGGAMAAILNATWSVLPSKITNRIGPIDSYRISTHSCYTFGMPKYGNLQAMELRQPYHLYNEDDIVPSVPPSWLGYETCTNEYMLNGIGIENKSQRDTLNFANWILGLSTGKGISNHSMELYKNRLESNLT